MSFVVERRGVSAHVVVPWGTFVSKPTVVVFEPGGDGTASAGPTRSSCAKTGVRGPRTHAFPSKRTGSWNGAPPRTTILPPRPRKFRTVGHASTGNALP